MLKYHLVSGLVFGLLALLQLMRAANQWPVQIASYELPLLVSWLAALVAGILCVWAFRSMPK